MSYPEALVQTAQIAADAYVKHAQIVAETAVFVKSLDAVMAAFLLAVFIYGVVTLIKAFSK